MQTERTILHYAAEFGFHDVAKLLLEKQTDANAVDKVFLLCCSSSLINTVLQYLSLINTSHRGMIE